MERVGFRASDFAERYSRKTVDNYKPIKKFMRLYTAVYKSGYCSIPISAPIGLFSQSLSHMVDHVLHNLWPLYGNVNHIFPSEVYCHKYNSKCNGQ